MGIVTNNYAYHINREIFDLVTDKQIADVRKNLGKAIQPAYENEESITPHKWMKSGLLGLTAGAAVINPLAGIAMGIIAAASYLSIDYDSPSERREAMRKVSKQTFEQIANSHDVDKIINYQLLDKITGVKHSDPTKKAYFYAAFKNLGDEFKALEKWQREEKSKIWDRWSKENETLNKDIEVYSPAYSKAIEPWNKWRNSEIAKITAVYNRILPQFEEKFHDLKQALT